MDHDSRSIVDSNGLKATFKPHSGDSSQADVTLESGERLLMPSALAKPQRDGTFRFEHSFSQLLGASSDRELIIPVVAEQLEVEKRVVDRERVRITMRVSSHEEAIDVPLLKEELKVERVPIGRNVERTVQPRQEGDTLIVPVYEEVLVVHKQLVLREEIRVTCVRHEERTRQSVRLRREDAVIDRSTGAQAPKPDHDARTEPQLGARGPNNKTTQR